MGCFSLHGCISQLPISGGDKIVGILCRIHSTLERSNSIELIDDFELLPMCPIIYGTYDDYGSIDPVKSKTTELLEEFFEHDIKSIVDAFTMITIGTISDEDKQLLQPLLDKRDCSHPRSIRVHEIPENPQLYYMNRWCILLEHESVVRTIIDSHKPMLDKFYYYREKPDESDWSLLYDKQHRYFKDNNLDIYGIGEYDFDIARDLMKYANLLFPTRTYSTYRGIYRSNLMMDLFQNYPDMFEYVFDTDIKDDYVDTLKLFDVLEISQLKLNINRNSGSQFENIKLWDKLTETYSNIIRDKNEY